MASLPWNRLFAPTNCVVARGEHQITLRKIARSVALNNAFDVVDRETLERSWGVLKKGSKLVTVASTIEGNVEQCGRDAFINGNKLTERKHYG